MACMNQKYATMRRSTNEFYRIVVVVWLTVSVASVFLAAASWFQLSERLGASTAAVALRDNVDSVWKLLIEATSAQRGFVLTGHETFLRSLRRSEAELPGQIEHLTELACQNPELLLQVMELRVKIENALAFNRKAVALRREKGFRSAAAMAGSDEDEKNMEDVRRKVESISVMRSDLTSPEGRSARSQLLRASMASLLSGAFGVGAGILAFVLTRLAMQSQQRAQQSMLAKIKAERVSQEKTDFLANMSHEIRTPMNAILGFSELLNGELRDPLQRQYVQSIRTSACSLLQLINEVLEISKVEAGAMELRPEPMDPREFCEFIKAVFSESVAKKGLKLECHVAEDMPLALLFDRSRLRRILINLVGNAVKFTEKGRIDIRVSWEKQPQRSLIVLIFAVQDTGLGIPQEKLDAIFEPFVQAGRNRGQEREGTGLGLSIVKRLTESMGGTITVASIVDEGSVFEVRFSNVPILAGLVPVGPEESSKVDFNELRAATLLVVDDNALNRQLMAGIFEGSHHRLVCESNGREAVEQARALHPDIALLDIRMPEMDGRDALMELRKIPGLERVPVIAVTASGMPEQEMDLREKFNGYLHKPFSQRQLFEELAHFLPRQPKVERSNVRSEASPVAGKWRELAVRLHRLCGEEWPGLRDGLAINEILAFARKLEQMGSQANCDPVVAYACQLAEDAKTYAVDKLERHLEEFPTLVEKVERSAPV
jgi:signal transduction histidine kinase/FixJ family two-component response regulator